MRHFVRKFCVFYLHIIIAVFNGRQLPTVLTLLSARHGTGKEKENFSGFQGIQCGVFIKL
jgi:hypothetical protein